MKSGKGGERERKKDREREGEREISYLLAESLMLITVRFMSETKQQVRNLIQVSHLSGKYPDTGALICCPTVHISWKLGLGAEVQFESMHFNNGTQESKAVS